jgi:hypothetical protein
MLPDGPRHAIILTAMASYYVSAPECSGAEADAIARAVTDVLGVPLRVAVLIFTARRRLMSLTRRAFT